MSKTHRHTPDEEARDASADFRRRRAEQTERYARVATRRSRRTAIRRTHR